MARYSVCVEMVTLTSTHKKMSRSVLKKIFQLVVIALYARFSLLFANWEMEKGTMSDTNCCYVKIDRNTKINKEPSFNIWTRSLVWDFSISPCFCSCSTNTSLFRFETYS